MMPFCSRKNTNLLQMMALSNLAFMALLITSVSTGEASCPGFCTCPMQLRADCCNSSLKQLPQELHSEIRYLNISNNLFTGLTRYEFHSRNILHLRILDLSDNKISIIENGSFTDLKELIFLYLSRNEITTIDQDIFKFNPRLEFLELDGNALELPRISPFINSPSIKFLDMSSCNIRDLPENTFVRLPNLEELRLSHNRMRSLETAVFHPLKFLKSLYLSHNLINELPEDIFISLKYLVILDLSNNELQDLPPRIFTFLESVEHLDLSNNKLKTLESGVFTPMLNLKRLHLHKNVLHGLNEEHFSELNNLAVLDLSENHLEGFQFRIMCHLNNLTYLKVSDNRIACDCALWEVWNWSKENGIKILTTCDDSGFGFSSADVDTFHYNNTCNATTCDFTLDSGFENEITPPTYLYVITGVGFLLVFVACALIIFIVIRYRKEFCKKNNIQVSTIEYPQSSYITRYNPDQQFPHFQQLSSDGQFELQQELHRQHQQTLMRNRLHRERSRSLKSLTKQEPQDNRLSYHEYRVPTFPDQDSSWYNADTLPSNNRTNVFLQCESSLPHDQEITFRNSMPGSPDSETVIGFKGIRSSTPKKSTLLTSSPSVSDLMVPERNVQINHL